MSSHRQTHQPLELLYFHDPMCSWCWGFKPTWNQLTGYLNSQSYLSTNTPLTVTYIVGGLAPDSDQMMPLEQQQQIQAHWSRIETLLGTEFNHDFWKECTPRRSTYPACRAVIVARQLGYEQPMIQEIQEAYYCHAKNPSDRSTLVDIAYSLGIEVDTFERLLDSDETEQQLIKEITFARQSPISGFPSLVLRVGDSLHSITLDYKNYRTMGEEISAIVHNAIV